MKIVVVDFAAEKGGALSILKDFANKAKLYKNIDWYFILSDKYVEESSNIKVLIYDKNRLNRLKFDFFSGKNIINKMNPDLVINFQNTYIYGLNTSQIIYLHQSIPFQNNVKFSFLDKKQIKFAIIQYILGFIIKLGLPKANLIIVQSNWMKEAVLKDKKIKNNNIVIVPPNLNKEFIESLPNPEIDFTNFFYPTSDLIYKKNDFLINTFKKFNNIMHNSNTKYKLSLTMDNKLSETDNSIKFLGHIPRREVLRRMSSSVLVFPSNIETFGMPLMEAKVIGGVIFAASTEFSHEILDDYENAYFFEMNNEEQLIKLLVKSVKNQIHYNTIKKNFENDDSWAYFIDTIIKNKSLLEKKEINNGKK